MKNLLRTTSQTKLDWECVKKENNNNLNNVRKFNYLSSENKIQVQVYRLN